MIGMGRILMGDCIVVDSFGFSVSPTHASIVSKLSGIDWIRAGQCGLASGKYRHARRQGLSGKLCAIVLLVSCVTTHESEVNFVL